MPSAVVALTPVCTRIGAAIVLQETAASSAVEPHHFDPQWWSDRGAAIGSASGRGTVRFVRAGDEVWALRHYLRGGWAARFNADRYFWRGVEHTRPWREWRLTRELRRLGLPVPEPVAARVVRHGMFYRGDLLTRLIPDATPLTTILSTRALPGPAWFVIGATLRRFHEAGVRHDDINASNLLYDDAARVHLIDFDKARIVPAGGWRERNLARLRRSLEKCRRLRPGFHFDDRDWQALSEGYAAAPGVDVLDTSTASARPLVGAFK